jgi:hypothetical protein
MAALGGSGQSRAPPNISLHLTGMSLLLIENFNDDAVDSRQVNSGVIVASALWHDDRHKIFAEWSCRAREAT